MKFKVYILQEMSTVLHYIMIMQYMNVMQYVVNIIVLKLNGRKNDVNIMQHKVKFLKYKVR